MQAEAGRSCEVAVGTGEGEGKGGGGGGGGGGGTREGVLFLSAYPWDGLAVQRTSLPYTLADNTWTAGCSSSLTLYCVLFIKPISVRTSPLNPRPWPFTQ